MSAEKPRAATVLNQGSLCWPGWRLGLGRMCPGGCPGRLGPGRGRLGRGGRGLGSRRRALEASLGRRGPGRRAHGPSRRAPMPPLTAPMPGRRAPIPRRRALTPPRRVPMPSRRALTPPRRAPVPSRRSPMPSRIAFTIAGRGRLMGAASGAIRGYRWGVVRRLACALCVAGLDNSWFYSPSRMTDEERQTWLATLSIQAYAYSRATGELLAAQMDATRDSGAPYYGRHVQPACRQVRRATVQ